MAAVDFDLKFTYVLAGWEGSAHDALILANALEREDGLKVPTGKFFLVDAGYAMRLGFLPPYRGTRYHLKEYGRGNHPQNAKELFNLRHSSLRTSVERAFAAYKNRWKFVYNKPFHGYKTQVKVVLACAILHNWVLQYGEDEYFPPEETWDPEPNDEDPNDIVYDNHSWAQKRDEFANHMWANRGLANI
uniref:DDE Tnp4 domain-containing protein n=1 Tax=Aegilops tauschii subsp. strangulata TaxID=200361 RepID=A0A453K3T1_AEGTS